MADKVQPVQLEDGVINHTQELYQHDETIILDIDAVKGGDANTLRLANDGHVSPLPHIHHYIMPLTALFRQFLFPILPMTQTTLSTGAG